jgi:endonuclease-3
MLKKERVKKFIEYYSHHLPKATTELNYKDPYELAIAVILSAQCTDNRVNKTTPILFKQYPTIQELAKAKHEDVYPLIKNISYPNNKTKHIIEMAKIVTEQYSGKLPDNVNELMKLPGIGRKSANVLAAILFNIPTMPVDTHVFRVAARIGLTINAKNVLEAEKQLVEIIPKDKLNLAHHWLILHGRYICTARKPKCNECNITDICKYYQTNNSTLSACKNK